MKLRRRKTLSLVPLLWTAILPRTACLTETLDAGSRQVPLRGGDADTWEEKWSDGPSIPLDTQIPHNGHPVLSNDRQGPASKQERTLHDYLLSIEHSVTEHPSPSNSNAVSSSDLPALAPYSNSATTFGSFPPTTPSPTLSTLLQALTVMQDRFFEVWRGTWPSAIDWTAAVLGTQVSGALSAITLSTSYVPQDSPFGNICENTIAGYFSHISSFYFGENAFSLRLQAYDDMLWVVLGWLEAIQSIRTHSDAHYMEDAGNSSWYARHFIPAFAHRARIFWDLAHKGWDTTLCGGGMIWNPELTPYKNAITNELYIAASASMYLYFPGDNNGFPFSQASEGDRGRDMKPLPPVKPHDPKYLTAAQGAYDWLMASGMTNWQGLFVDGFHIKGWRPGRGGSNGTEKCDVRNEMVYSYNQGVILTGQRGLWRATGNTSYLDAGHALIANVIKATGWQEDGVHFPGWCGLGRRGVIEERCDAWGDCSQNGQTFKGIFFHHMATFCADLEQDGDEEIFFPATPEEAALHAQRCANYTPWLARNARAAAGTRNGNGEFGTWWTIGLDVYPPSEATNEATAEAEASNSMSPPGDDDKASEDYRNAGLPFTSRWRGSTSTGKSLPGTWQTEGTWRRLRTQDPNDRGRGRTVETQSGGVAVLKALYALVERKREEVRRT